MMKIVSFSADPNYLEERRVTLSIPIQLSVFKGYTRMSFKQNVFETLTYNTGEILISAYFGRLNANVTGYTNWVSGQTPYFSSNVALAFRLGRSATLRSQAMIDLNNNELISYKFELEKRISRSGYLSVGYEDITRSSFRSVNFSFRYDLPFAQANASSRFSEEAITTTQGVRGSIAFGSGNGYVYTDNRSVIGRGGLTLIPFLDINHNGKRDIGEPITPGLDVRINGGRLLNRTKDSLVRIVELEPYTSYLLELDDVGFEEISWQLKTRAVNVFVDPNQFKKIEIPVAPMGEINGMVYLSVNRTHKGLGRVIVDIKHDDGKLITKLITEQDGYYTFLGLPPGKYYASINSDQMQRINMSAEPENIPFEILQSAWGDIVDGIDFTLKRNDVEDLVIEEPVPAEQEVVGDVKPVIEDQQIDTTGQQVARPDEKDGQREDNVPVQVDDDESKSHEVDANALNPDAGRYFVQAGTFSSNENATKIIALLRDVIPYPMGILVENDLHKVRFGYFSARAEAQHCYQLIIDEGYDAYIGLKK
nr:SPOR domain-containing protein [Bacteroidota bacterium]